MKRNQDAVKTARESRERDQRPLSTGTARGLVVQDRLLIGVGACAGVIALASNAFQSIYQQVSGTAVETALPIWGNIAYAGQIALMLFVVLGVYLAQRSGFGRFGTVASAIALLGTMLWAAACVHQFLDVLAVSPGTAPEPPGRVIVVMMSFFALHAIGLLMLGIATWRPHPAEDRRDHADPRGADGAHDRKRDAPRPPRVLLGCRLARTGRVSSRDCWNPW
jgi:hypothetical protein